MLSWSKQKNKQANISLLSKLQSCIAGFNTYILSFIESVISKIIIHGTEYNENKWV